MSGRPNNTRSTTQISEALTEAAIVAPQQTIIANARQLLDVLATLTPAKRSVFVAPVTANIGTEQPEIPRMSPQTSSGK